MSTAVVTGESAPTLRGDTPGSLARTRILALSLGVLVVVPLVVALTFTSVGALGDPGATTIRGIAILNFFLLALFSLVSREGRIRLTLPWSSWRTHLAWLLLLGLVGGMVGSILANGVTGERVLRIGLQAIYMLTLTLLYPAAVVAVERDIFLKTFSRFYVVVALGLGLAAILFLVSGQTPIFRLGWPLAPGVFATYMLIGWVVAAMVLRRPFLSAVFALLTVSTGSRSNLLILGLLVLIWMLRSQRSWKGVARILAFLALFGGLVLTVLQVDPDRFRPYTVERQDLTSGRISIWGVAINQLSGGGFFVGAGEPVEVEYYNLVAGTIQSAGAHNALLDDALAYGVPFGFLSAAAWVIVFFPGLAGFWRREYNHYLLSFCLFSLISLRALVTDTFWSNMGDPATISAVILLVAGSPKLRARHAHAPAS